VPATVKLVEVVEPHTWSVFTAVMVFVQFTKWIRTENEPLLSTRISYHLMTRLAHELV
jgi:hypothetical protein